MKIFDCENYAKKYGKHDLERLGMFIEMPFMGVKRKKVKPHIIIPEIEVGFITNPMKSKCGNQDGYFEERFKRLPCDKPKTVKRQKAKAPDKLPFLPASPSKKHSTPNDYYGCFTEPLEEFSPRLREKKKKPLAKPNMITNPAKKGGCGYVDITIAPYPEHQTDRHEPPPMIPARKRKVPKVIPFYPGDHPGYLDDNPFLEEDPKGKIYIPLELKQKKKDTDQKKKKGKLKQKIFVPYGYSGYNGYFTEFPEYKTNRDKRKERKGIIFVVSNKAPFLPASNLPLKTMQYRAVLQNTKLRVNEDNYKTFEPDYVKYL